MNKYQIFYTSSEKMNEIKDKEIKSIITSPPYWHLKNYQTDEQIGYDETYEEYLNRLEKVWKECYRILKDDGSIWININYRHYKKQFYNIPYDFVKSLEKIGFKFQELFIWHKPSGIPASPKNLSDHFEHILFFTKSKKFKFNKKELWEDMYGLLDKNKIGNSWRIVKKGGNLNKFNKHPAAYPTELVEKIVKISSEKNDTILDPFLGSGTTLIGAVKLNRNFKGFEINNKEYKEIIEYRIKNEIKNDINHYL